MRKCKLVQGFLWNLQNLPWMQKLMGLTIFMRRISHKVPRRPCLRI